MQESCFESAWVSTCEVTDIKFGSSAKQFIEEHLFKIGGFRLGIG